MESLEFFAPMSPTQEVALEGLHNVADHLSNIAFPVARYEPIYSLRYEEGGTWFRATVGKHLDHPRLSGAAETLVLFIFRTLHNDNLFFVVTRDRGAVRGNPLMIGASPLNEATYFSPLEG